MQVDQDPPAGGDTSAEQIQQPAAMQADTSISWETLAKDASAVVAALAPIAESMATPAAPAIAVGVKILQGALALEPTAVALVNQIKNGTPPTAAQMQQFASDYEAAYQELHADIATQLAALPAS